MTEVLHYVRDCTHPASFANIDDRFRVIFDAVNDGIFIIDPATSRFTEINQPGCGMFGYEKAELIGCNIGTLSSGIHPFTQEIAFEWNGKARSAGPQIFEWQCKTKIGVLVWTEISIRFTTIGNIPVIIALVRDIDDRKRLDEDLKLALLSASEANKAKSIFLANMSHELRTPLNAIIGFSDIMQSEMFGLMGNARYLGYSKDIFNSGKHLLGLINDVLDLSKLDAGQHEMHDDVVDVEEVVSDSFLFLKTLAEAKQIALTATHSNLPMKLRADRQKLRQIIVNLLSNAVKFTPVLGSVTVFIARQGTALALTVADTGIGMTPEQLPIALSRFGQIDSSHNRKYEGTGLGLPIAKRLAELHGATFTISSELGKGTAVTVLFPAERVVGSSNAVQPPPPVRNGGVSQ